MRNSKITVFFDHDLKGVSSAEFRFQIHGCSSAFDQTMVHYVYVIGNRISFFHYVGGQENSATASKTLENT